MVKFCDKCDNIFNHFIDQDGRFTYLCRLCGNINTEMTEKCIVVNELNRTSRDYKLNKNMVCDRSLPRTMKMKCPQCEQNTEIVIFQHNPDILNVGYMCTVCQTYWKN